MKLVVKISLREDGLFRAWCPALPGCSVHADSEDEARRKIESAIRSYMMSFNVIPPTELSVRLQMSSVSVG